MEAKNKLQFCAIFLIFFSLLVISLPVLVLGQESSPQFPHLFYGTSKINDLDTPVGTVIVAKVNGVEKGRITVAEAGKYGGLSGNQNKLLVQGNIEEGAEIEFYISGVKANEVHSFESGDITEKNITWDFPSTIEISQTPISNEPITCVSGTTIKVVMQGLELQTSCDDAAAGTINNVTDLGSTYFIGSPEGTSSVSNTFEISVSGNFDVIAVMSYNDTGIDESTITVYKFVGGSWVSIPSSDIISIDTVNNKITFRLTPGTPYAGFGSEQIPTPATPTNTPSGPKGGGGGGGGAAALTAQPAATTTPAITETSPQQPTTPTTTPTTTATVSQPTNPLTGFVAFVTSPNGIMVSISVLAVLALSVWYFGFKKSKKTEISEVQNNEVQNQQTETTI